MTTKRLNGGNLILGILIVAVGMLILMQWRQHEQIRRVQAENEQLRRNVVVQAASVDHKPDEPATIMDEPFATPPSIENAATAAEDPHRPGSEPAIELVPTPTGVAPGPRESGMALADIQSKAVEGGIEAKVKFSPTVDVPMGVVAVVVRIPRDREGRILALDLISASGLDDVSSRISDDGKFAVFHGTAHHVEDLDVVLKVSGPVKVDFRGTSGIGPYDLITEEDGAFAGQK